jgi:hypothetical protein
MDFTFGIVTSGLNDEFLSRIINDIKCLNIINYEIIIVGGNTEFEGTTHIKFDESQKPMWITRKKNIITENAKYENIVYTHDYITFDRSWYEEFLKFGNNFSVCMNRINNTDGSRYRDWVLWPGDPNWEKENGYYNNIQINNFISDFIIPYSCKELSKFMYISGAYWVAKKELMLEFPINENLIWGQGEDVDWSMRVRSKYIFSINEKSEVNLLKYKDKIFNIATEESVSELIKKLNIKND